MADKMPMNAPLEEKAPSGTMQDDESMADVMMVLKLFDQAKKAREDYDRDWTENWDFYHGKQWKQDKKRLSLNICRIAIQSMMPILTDADPGFNVTPQEPSDYVFAKNLGEIITYWFERRSIRSRLVEGLTDAMVTDIGYLKIMWNADLENGAGDIDVEVCDPKDIFTNKGCVDFDNNCQYVIHRYHKTVGELKRKFPDFADEIKPDAQDTVKQEDKDQSIENVTVVSPTDQNVGEQDYPGGAQDERKTALVYECWIDDESLEEYYEENDKGEEVRQFKKKYPHGKLVTILPTKKVRLQCAPHPYEHGKKPFVRLIDVLIPRQLIGEGEIGPLKDVQKHVNKTAHTILAWQNRMSNASWISEKNNGIDPDRITNEVAMILTPDEGKLNTIKMNDVPSLPAYIPEWKESLLRFGELITGSSEITQGRKPVGVTAGTAIETLQEAAQSRIRLKERNLQTSMRQMGLQVIGLIMQYYSRPRVVKITGNEKWPEYFEFWIEKTEDGKYVYRRREHQFNPEQETFAPGDWQASTPSAGMFDVKVMAGTAMPWAKTQRINTAFKLFEAAAIDQEELLKSVEWPDYQQVLQRIKEQQALAPPVEGVV